MKLRLSGTPTECQAFVTALIAATSPGVVQQVSGFYPNRDGRGGRVYLDLALPGISSTPGTTPTRERPDNHRSSTNRSRQRPIQPPTSVPPRRAEPTREIR